LDLSKEFDFALFKDVLMNNGNFVEAMKKSKTKGDKRTKIFFSALIEKSCLSLTNFEILTKKYKDDILGLF